MAIGATAPPVTASNAALADRAQVGIPDTMNAAAATTNVNRMDSVNRATDALRPYAGCAPELVVSQMINTPTRHTSVIMDHVTVTPRAAFLRVIWLMVGRWPAFGPTPIGRIDWCAELWTAGRVNRARGVLDGLADL